MNCEQKKLKLPSYLLEGDFTQIQKRYYSICNDPVQSPNKIELLFTKHRFTVDDREQTGHCSDYLSGFALGRQVRC